MTVVRPRSMTLLGVCSGLRPLAVVSTVKEHTFIGKTGINQSTADPRETPLIGCVIGV